MTALRDGRWTRRAAPRRTPGMAGWYGVAGFVAVAVYYLLPDVAPGMSQGITYDAISAAAAAAIVVALVVHRPARPLPWVLLAVAQLSYVVGDVIYEYENSVLHVDAYPTLADAFYLLEYPIMVLALVIFIRRRTPGWHLATLIDASVIAIGLGLLSWVYIISPLASAPDVTALARAVSVSYPIMDLLVLVVSLRLILGAGARSATFYLLLVSSLTMLVADVIYAVQNQLGTWRDGTWIDALWLIEYVLLGAAALHPSMRKLDERSTVAPPDASTGRLAGLAVASLIAPVVLLVQHLRGGPDHVVVISLCCVGLFLLVLARMAGLVAVQRRVAITDSLTGLYTRGFLQETLRVEVDRAARGETALGVLLIDADHFKRVNDTYGHPVGDRVLRELAARLRATCRPGDVIARYGGEEFAVLLSGADARTVAAVAERVRAGVADEPLPLGGGFLLQFTISIGAATLDTTHSTGDAVILAADHALYAAKHAGRNLVVRAWEMPGTETETPPVPAQPAVVELAGRV